MNTPRIIIALLAFNVGAHAQQAEAPTEVKLTSGSTLRRVEVVRFEPGLVVLKHQGGIDPIRFNYIAEPHRSQLLAYEKAMKSKPKKEVRNESREIAGQAFITTRGAGSYKLSDTPIVAYPAGMKQTMIQAQASNLPNRYATMGVNYNDVDEDAYIAWRETMGQFINEAVASTVTDADGKFVLRLKTDQPVCILAYSKRLAGRTTEFYSWFVEVQPGESVNFTVNNLWSQPK